jgi:hypothetical protein
MIDISYMDGASANPHRIAQGLVRKCEVVHSGKTTRGLGQEEPRAGYMLSPPPGRFPPPCSGLIPVLPCEEAADEVPAPGIRTNRQGRAVTDTCPPLVLWRAMAAWLATQGYVVNRKRVRRLMRLILPGGATASSCCSAS